MGVATVAGEQTGTASPVMVRAGRYAGIGGLVFVVALVVQNLLRARAPGLDAAPAAVSDYFLHHRAARSHPARPLPDRDACPLRLRRRRVDDRQSQ